MDEEKKKECRCPACGATKEIENPENDNNARCNNCGIVMDCEPKE